MAMQTGPCDAIERAGRSAQAEYERRSAEWRNSRRQAAVRWGPAALLVAALGGWYLTATTEFPLLGLIFTALVLGAVVDVLFRPPHVLRELRQAAAGERATGRLLAKAQRDGWAVLHDRRTRRGRVDVEHLLVGPAGAFLLDSRNWASVKEPMRVQAGRFWIGRDDQSDLLAGLRSAAEAATRDIGDVLEPGRLPGPLGVDPMVVVHGARVAGSPRVLGGVAVVEASQLLRYLARAEQVWGPDQVRQVAAAAEQVLPVKEP